MRKKSQCYIYTTSINQLGNDQQAAVRVCRTGGERQNMVIRCHVHTIIERTAGNSLTQNLLEGRTVRVGLNAVSVGGNITDPHTENLVSQFFICQRNINVRVLLPKLEHTIFVQILKPSLVVFIGKGVPVKIRLRETFTPLFIRQV